MFEIVTKFLGMEGGEFNQDNAPQEFDLRINGVRNFNFYYSPIENESDIIDVYISFNDGNGIWFGHVSFPWNSPIKSLSIYSSQEGANLISFTMTMDPNIPSLLTYPEIVYQAEEGMTWIDWCDSSYNINGYSIVDTDVGLKVMHNYGNYGGLVCQGSSINADTIIEDGGVYYYE